VLVSAETVKDFQLSPGDLLRLRLPTAYGTTITVPFIRGIGCRVPDRADRQLPGRQQPGTCHSSSATTHP